MKRDIDELHFNAFNNGTPTKTFYNVGATPSANSTYATAKSALTASSIITPKLLRYAKTWALTGGNRTQVPLEPIMIDGKPHYVCLLHTDVVEYDLKNNSEYQQAIREAESRGKSNPLFTGAIAVVDNVIIHAHESVEIGTNAGSGSDVPYCKGVMLGKNALMQGWGAFKGMGQNQMKMVLEPYASKFNEVGGYYYKAMVNVEKPVRNSVDYGSFGFLVARTNVSGS
jgi:N4-gp56 family major capsid protein